MEAKNKKRKERKKYRLSTRFLSISLFITISIVIAFAVFSVIKEYNLFKENAEIQRKNLRNEVDSLMKNEVDKAIDYIRFTNLFTEKKLRDELRERGHQAWGIANNIYLENSGKSQRQIKKSIKDALRPIRFYNERGYYFICSMSGIEELYPVRPEFEGTNVIELQDSKGKYVIQNEIELLKREQEGFVVDYWYKPGGSADSAYSKTSFVKRFDPFSWYIGCGEYLDNVENDLKGEVLGKLKSALYSKSGNLFIFDKRGLLLLDSEPQGSQQSKDFRFISSNKEHIFSRLQNQISKAETSFFDISLIEHDSVNKKSYKIHARQLPEWDWIICSYSDLSIIDGKILDEKHYLQEELKSRFLALALFLLVVVVVIFILTKELQKMIRKAFVDFSHQLAGMINEQRPIDPDKFQLENFSVMAEYANKLLEKQLEVQKALTNSEDRFQKLYKNAPVMILAIDDKMNLKLCNKTCDKFFKIQSEKFINKMLPLAQTIENNDFEKLRNSLKSCDNIFREHELHFMNGEIYIQNWASFKVDDNLEFWVGYDLTELKLIQRQLKERHAFLNTLINSIPIPVFYKDIEGKYLGANEAFCEMLGKSHEELIDKEVFEVAPKHLAEKYRQMDLDLIKQGGSQVYEYHVKHPNESEHFYVFYKTVYNDLAGKPGGIIGIMLDITDRKRVEEQLRELNATKDKFFSIIAHDLKNPFNALLGLSDVLNISYNSLNEDQRKEIVQNVYSSAETLYKLLENLLHWARSQSGSLEFNPEKINLGKIICSVIEISEKQAEEKQIIIDNKVSEDVHAFADNQMIHTVLRNLISNAIKFTGVGGLVTIEYQLLASKDVQITVKDTGVGIPEKNIDKLFRIDTKVSTRGTKQENGTGLGLILCKEFVAKNGGEIGVESEEGLGSRFYFTLPVSGSG